jgi:hypothetical protein
MFGHSIWTYSYNENTIPSSRALRAGYAKIENVILKQNWSFCFSRATSAYCSFG